MRTKEHCALEFLAVGIISVSISVHSQKVRLYLELFEMRFQAS